jgi:hypothetical protein
LEERGLVTDGEFTPGMTANAASAVIESLSRMTEVAAAARDKQRQGLSWRQMQQELLREFASRQQQLDSMNEKMARIKCDRPYASFVSEVKNVYNLHGRLYSDNSDHRNFVRWLLGIIPLGIAKSTVESLVRVKEDFELLPFSRIIDEIDRKLQTKETVDRLRIGESATGAKAVSSVSPSAPRRIATVNQVSESNAPKMWQSDWCKTFKVVLYFSGTGHEEELKRVVAANPGLEVRFVPRGKKGPFALLGCPTESVPALSCYDRPFTPYPPKSKN